MGFWIEYRNKNGYELNLSKHFPNLMCSSINGSALNIKQAFPIFNVFNLGKSDSMFTHTSTTTINLHSRTTAGQHNKYKLMLQNEKAKTSMKPSTS